MGAAAVVHEAKSCRGRSTQAKLAMQCGANDTTRWPTIRTRGLCDAQQSGDKSRARRRNSGVQANAGVGISERQEASEGQQALRVVTRACKVCVLALECGRRSATPICSHQAGWSLRFVSSTSSHTRPDQQAESLQK